MQSSQLKPRSTNVPGYALTNSFFDTPQLSQRLKMLVRPSSSRSKLWLYGAVIPLSVGMVMCTQSSKEADKIASQQTAQTINKKAEYLGLEKLEATWLKPNPNDKLLDLSQKKFKHFYVNGHAVSYQSFHAALNEGRLSRAHWNEATQTVRIAQRYDDPL